MTKALTLLEIAELAVTVAQKLNMRVPSVEVLIKNMNRCFSLPQQFKDAHSQLWVDKYYIAYSRWDDPDVHYVYLTPTHIAEEYTSYKELRREARKTYPKLPESIRKQFVRASRQMRRTQKNFVIFKIV